MSSVPPQHEGIHFLDLPEEALDMIYRLAYPRERKVCKENDSFWGYVGRPSQVQGNVVHAERLPHKIDDLLVCKAFFESASKA